MRSLSRYYPRWTGSGFRTLAAAMFALALLACGGAAHLQHHIDDPSCESGPAPESHACASCSNLHGGAVAEDAPSAGGALAAWMPLRICDATDPTLRATHDAGAPRAPPLA
jgi:hypothetical protein